MGILINKLRVHIFDQSVALRGVVTIFNCDLRVYRGMILLKWGYNLSESMVYSVIVRGMTLTVNYAVRPFQIGGTFANVISV